MSQEHNEWWRGAVIYQVYPRSYLDSNGDGIGDLPGVTRRLDYIASLGVDAIWLSPFFRSPMLDFGYDVADYRDVDPIFGTLADFDALLERAHGLGLRVIIDLVLSHTSDQHPWFLESRNNHGGERGDWYVWVDPRQDGSPPNNWLSIFGGSAWEWDPVRRQYYLHNFLANQPDLNFHSPAVQEAVLDVVRYWLERGVDGFRLDCVNFYFHDRLLRLNPPASNRATSRSTRPDNPYSYQEHVYDKTRPETVRFLERIRALLDHYPGSISVGEVGAEDALPVMANYTAGNCRLHMAYSFELLADDSGADYIRSTVEEFERRLGDGWPCWSTGNHDVVRVLTRWGGDTCSPPMARAFMATLLSLRGTICLYQGEELGLEEACLRHDQLQDPYGIRFWPRFRGRDGCRTPMPWRHDAPQAGFTSGVPWLPVPEGHRARAVDVQTDDPRSTLSGYRRFLHWRRGQPALQRGSITFLDAPDGVLLLYRTLFRDTILVAVNLSAETRHVQLAATESVRALDGHGFGGCLDGQTLILPPWEAWFGRFDSDNRAEEMDVQWQQ